jgi:hypothetical protein
VNLRKGIIIFLLSAILCTWLAPLIHPILHYDELSAVSRAQNYSSLTNQWELGIKPDGHPPLLQLIIWSIVQLGGLQTFLLRFIGIAFGLWSIIEGFKLSILIVNNQKNPTSTVAFFRFLFTKKSSHNHPPLVGFITLLLLSLWWWYAAMGYQIRPYSLALPFVFRTWAWAMSTTRCSHKLIFSKVVTMAIYTIIAAWIHHFAFLSCLTAFVIFTFRWFEYNARRYSKQVIAFTWFKILSLFISLVLIGYIPVLEILKSQLNEGGLAWLGKPSTGFLFDFFSSNFHPFLVLLLLLLITLAVVTRPLQSGYLLFGFLFQYVLLHSYSLLFKPVLQPSSLYFSLPLLFVLADIGWVKIAQYLSKVKSSLVLVSTGSLPVLLGLFIFIDTAISQQWFTQRQKNYHYQFAQAILANPKSNLWMDAEMETIQFHLPKKIAEYSTVNWLLNCNNPGDIIKKLSTLNQGDSIIVCTQAGTHPWILPVLSTYFTSVKIQAFYIGAQITTFSGFDRFRQNKNPFQCHPESTASITNTYRTKCDYHCPVPLSNDTLIYNSNDTLTFTYSVDLMTMNTNANDVIVVIAPVEWKSHNTGLVIESTLHNDSEQIDWRGTLYQDFQHPGCNYAIHTIKLSDIPGWNNKTRLGIKVYGAWAWIGRWSGNPYLYGISPYNQR